MNQQRMLHNLPVEAYTSQEWFDREQELIFSKTWRYAGFQEDIAEPGDYTTVQAGLNNIFIVMGRDRRLRAFHNICRHRGTQLIRTVGKQQKALVCPYHDWTYDLDGNLVSVPEENSEFGGIDKSCYNLKPASVDIWRGMIFVHPDPDAGSIMNWFGDVEPRLGPHKVEELPEYEEGAMVYDIEANWKIVVENYIDIYHLSHLHEGTLHMYDHSKAIYGFVGPHFVMQEPLSENYAKSIEKGTPSPLIIPKDKAGTWVPMLFPGIGLAEGEHVWSTYIVTPLGPSSTRVENRSRVAPVSDWAFLRQGFQAFMYWGDKIRGKFELEESEGEDDPLASGDFTAEDIYACEQQQKSLQSLYFRVGPAAASEKPVLEHQKVVLNWLENDKPQM